MTTRDRRYFRIAAGTTVTVTRTIRRPVPGTNFKEWDERPAGQVGAVDGPPTNAGFRGLEYAVILADGTRFTGISPVDMVLPHEDDEPDPEKVAAYTRLIETAVDGRW